MRTDDNRKYFIVTGLLVAAALVVSFCVGRYPLTLKDIGEVLSGGRGDEMAVSVFYTLRLPRTVMALLVGAGLGMVGSIYQMIFKNPLASPDLIGVSSGANLGAALVIVFFGQGAASLVFGAFAGGILAMFFVVSLARLDRSSSAVTYILFGIIAKAVSDAFIMILKFTADPEKQLASIEYWTMGSLGSVTASKLAAVLPFFFVGFAGMILMRRHIALLGLEDDESRALGVRLKYLRTAVLGLTALTVASAISMTGLVVFVGLNAPHIARLALKRTGFACHMLSAMIGALLLLVSDCIARSVSTVEIPVSIPTTFIGVPILLYFMLKRKAGTV